MYSEYDGNTTHWINQNIVKNQIAKIQFHCAFIPSIQLTAFVIKADQIANAIYNAHWGNTITVHDITNSKSYIQLIYNAKQAAKRCTKNLAQAGIFNLIFHIYSNSVIVSTMAINVHQAKNHNMSLFVHISGKNKLTTIMNIK